MRRFDSPGSGVEGGGLCGEAIELFLDDALVEIMRDKNDARTAVVIRPFGEFRRIVEHVLHAVNGNRFFSAGDVQNSFDP